MALLWNILYKNDIINIKPDLSMVQSMDEKKARDIQAIVYGKEKNVFKLITTNNLPEKLREYIRIIQNKWHDLDISYTTSDGFQEALKWYEEINKKKQEAITKQKTREQAKWQSAIDIIKNINDQSASMEPWAFVMELIKLSFQAWASDLHFQSEKEWTDMRLRIDWILYDVLYFEGSSFDQYISKIKFISWVKMNINDIPQDGRFSFQVKNRDGIQRDIDARVNFMPWFDSNSIVIRFLDSQSALKSFEEIGISTYNNTKLQRILQKSSGITILSWPTWSWKTTTLYAILNSINNWKQKIITFEDPVEYTIKWIQQSQINEYKWYTFESWMKAALRHDPDTILVWETRTKEVANIAINASLTGHRVLTTLHVNSAIETVDRLNNMWVHSYMLWSSLNAIASQRLVRKVCPHCKAKKEIDPQKKDLLIQTIQSIKNSNPNILWKFEIWEYNLFEAKWKGCEKCNNTWFLWRTAIFEILEISNEISKAIITQQSTDQISKIAAQEWFITMKQDWIIKVLQWLTTIDEVLRVVG